MNKVCLTILILDVIAALCVGALVGFDVGKGRGAVNSGAGERTVCQSVSAPANKLSCVRPLPGCGIESTSLGKQGSHVSKPCVAAGVRMFASQAEQGRWLAVGEKRIAATSAALKPTNRGATETTDIIRTSPPGSIIRRMRVTAYCPCALCCGKFSDGITASGKPVEANQGRFVAAPADIPFGTSISVPGYHGGLPVPVYDRGGAIKGDRLDVFYRTHQAALDWGVQYLDVVICN